MISTIISAIILCISLFANLMFLWEIICLMDDLDTYKDENERLTMYIDKLRYSKENNNG